MNNLRRLDMNLLLTLHVLLKERHVSHTATRLHKSQPAISHALNQLRDVFQDPLLVRENGVYGLTSKAQALSEPLERVLNELSTLLAANEFNPQLSQRHFRLAMSDYGSLLIMPLLMKLLRQQAPFCTIEVTSCTREKMQTGLITGQFDLIFSVFDAIDPILNHHTLFIEQLICLVDRQHPILNNITLDNWLHYPHLSVSTQPFDAGEIDQALSSQGLERNIVCTLPHWQGASRLLPQSDLILTIAAECYSQNPQAQLTSFQPPLALPTLNFQMLSHPRIQLDKAVLWLEQNILQLQLGSTAN